MPEQSTPPAIPSEEAEAILRGFREDRATVCPSPRSLFFGAAKGLDSSMALGWARKAVSIPRRKFPFPRAAFTRWGHGGTIFPEAMEVIGGTGFVKDNGRARA